MRKTILPAAAVATLMLGGCATGYGNPIGGVLGGILGGGNSGYGYNQNRTSQFERAAVDACGRQASRYGRVAIDRVTQNSRDTVRVDGRIDSRDRRRDQFRCIFRNDGRIVDFDLG